MPDETVPILLPNGKKPFESYIGQEGMPEGQHRPIGARSKESLEVRQLEMARRNNPSLTDDLLAEGPRQPLSNWLADNKSGVKSGTKRPISDAVRMFIEEVVGKNGKQLLSDRGGKERLLYILEALYQTALNDRSRNQLAAAQLMLAYAYGKPKESEESKSSRDGKGLTVVYVDRARIDPSIPVVSSEQLKSLPPPEFIDAEFDAGESNERK